jgi:XTP/dITP diphosphohydrolase
MAPPLLVLGTHNRKKGRELDALLAPLGIAVTTLADFPDALDVAESGDTFAANAVAKATQQAVHLKQWVLGEDSGLVVDAIGGRPGVYSARYSGPDATDQSNNRLLLEELADTPLERRTARYVCHLALSNPEGRVRAECEAACHGRIAHAEAGTAGFGYDPLFEIVEYHHTFGELGEAVKSVLSHRSRAIAMLVPRVRELLAKGEWERRQSAELTPEESAGGG